MARCASKRQTKDTERIQDWRFLPGRRGTRWLGPRKRDKLRAKLTNILLSADIRGVVSALVFQGPLPKRADYHVAIQYCMEGLVHQAFRYPVGERVTFVIDQKDKVKNEVEATRIWLQKDGHRSMGRRIGGAVFDDSRIILPLQAADLLAYEPLQEVKSYGIPGRGSPFVATVTMKTFGPRYMAFWSINGTGDGSFGIISRPVAGFQLARDLPRSTND